MLIGVLVAGLELLALGEVAAASVVDARVAPLLALGEIATVLLLGGIALLLLTGREATPRIVTLVIIVVVIVVMIVIVVMVAVGMLVHALNLPV